MRKNMYKWMFFYKRQMIVRYSIKSTHVRQYFDFLYSFVLDTCTSFGGQTTFTVNIFKIKILSQNLIF